MLKQRIFLQSLSPIFHMVSEEMIFKDIFSPFFAFWFPWQPIIMSTGQKNHLPDRGPLKEHFCKRCQNISQWLGSKCHFQFSHYKSKETLHVSCHSNQTKEQIFIKNTNFQSPSPRMLQMNFGPNQPSGFRGEVVWKCWCQTRTDDNCLSYKLPWGLRLWWLKHGFCKGIHNRIFHIFAQNIDCGCLLEQSQM